MTAVEKLRALGLIGALGVVLTVDHAASIGIAWWRNRRHHR